MSPEDTALSSELGAALLDDILRQPWDERAVACGPQNHFAVGSSKGTVRERNDDRTAVVQFLTPGLPNVVVFAVFDGVGSTREGGRAASLALAATVEFFAGGSKGPLSKILGSALRHADQVVYSALKGNGLTTGSVVVLGPRRDYFAANVGDSRIFAWDAGAGTLKQISQDDTLLNALQRNNIELESEVIRARGLDRSLSQALGERRTSSDELRVDVVELEPATPGVVVASDGAWSSGPFDIYVATPHASTSQDLVSRLIDANEWFGGRDNLSIAACRNLDAMTRTAATDVSRRIIHVWFPGGRSTFVSVDRPVESAASDGPSSGSRKRSRKKNTGDESQAEPRVTERERDGGTDEVERFPEPQVQE